MADLITKTIPQKMKCLVVDDEPIAIKGIVNNIKKLDYLEVAATCTSALEATAILREKEIDLMFLDINMPHLSGLELLESLENPPLTIFTTAYSEYALDGYRLNVVDYLMKPIPFERFFQAAAKAHNAFRSHLAVPPDNAPDAPRPDMYVRQGDAFKRIAWEEILYVEGMQNYVKLHFPGQTLTIHQTMTSLEEILPRETFFRIHRSYLVNTSRIDSIAGGRLFIAGKELPISKQRRDDLLNTVVYTKLISK